MSRRSDPESVVSKIQSQLEKKDLARKYSKDIKRLSKPSNTYTTSFINSQLRNKSFDTGKVQVSESFISRNSNDDRRHSKDKLHESFSHIKQSAEDLRSKSMYFTEINREEPKKEKNIKLSDYFQKCGELMGKVSHPKQEKKFSSQNILHQFEDFKIQDIGSLIQLIDTCVEEANSYIRDLTTKMERLLQEAQQLRRVNRRLEEMNKTHLVVIKEKEDQINRLTKNKPATKNQDLKNLLKVIDQLNQQNSSLKRQIDMIKAEQPRNSLNPTSAAKKREMYNQITRKIDILNISINREEDRIPQSNKTPQSITDVNQEQYLPKDTAEMANSSTGKKYKYIKPKSMSSM